MLQRKKFIKSVYKILRDKVSAYQSLFGVDLHPIEPLSIPLIESVFVALDSIGNSGVGSYIELADRDDVFDQLCYLHHSGKDGAHKYAEFIDVFSILLLEFQGIHSPKLAIQFSKELKSIRVPTPPRWHLPALADTSLPDLSGGIYYGSPLRVMLSAALNLNRYELLNRGSIWLTNSASPEEVAHGLSRLGVKPHTLTSIRDDNLHDNKLSFDLFTETAMVAYFKHEAVNNNFYPDYVCQLVDVLSVELYEALKNFSLSEVLHLDAIIIKAAQNSDLRDVLVRYMSGYFGYTFVLSQKITAEHYEVWGYLIMTLLTSQNSLEEVFSVDGVDIFEEGIRDHFIISSVSGYLPIFYALLSGMHSQLDKSNEIGPSIFLEGWVGDFPMTPPTGVAGMLSAARKGQPFNFFAYNLRSIAQIHSLGHPVSVQLQYEFSVLVDSWSGAVKGYNEGGELNYPLMAVRQKLRLNGGLETPYLLAP